MLTSPKAEFNLDYCADYTFCIKPNKEAVIFYTRQHAVTHTHTHTCTRTHTHTHAAAIVCIMYTGGIEIG